MLCNFHFRRPLQPVTDRVAALCALANDFFLAAMEVNPFQGTFA